MTERHLKMSERHAHVSERHVAFFRQHVWETCSEVWRTKCLRDMLALFQAKCLRDRLRWPRDILRCLGNILRCLRDILAFVQTNCLANVLGCLRGILCFSFFWWPPPPIFSGNKSFHHFWKSTKPARCLINMLRCKRNSKMSEVSLITAYFQTQSEETSFQTSRQHSALDENICKSGQYIIKFWWGSRSTGVSWSVPVYLCEKQRIRNKAAQIEIWETLS